MARGRELVAARYTCLCFLEYPISCTKEAAWIAFRAAMASEEYWFSVEELQFLFATCSILVEVYHCDAEVEEGAALDNVGSPCVVAILRPGDSVRVVWTREKMSKVCEGVFVQICVGGGVGGAGFLF